MTEALSKLQKRKSQQAKTAQAPEETSDASLDEILTANTVVETEQVQENSTQQNPQTSQQTFAGFPLHSLREVYASVELIAQGAQGRLYKGVTYDGQTEAVKRLHQAQDDDLLHKKGTYNGAQERFRREVVALTALGKLQVTPEIYRAFFSQDSETGELLPVIGMEYVQGKTLAELLEEGERGTEGKTLDLLTGLLLQLKEVHEQGFIHRDCNPKNIKVVSGEISAERTAYRLLDLGSSAEQQAGTFTLAVGTPEYIAPEQWRGDRELTKSADIFSLGVIAKKFLAEKPGGEMESILQKMTHEDATLRYASADEVLKDIEKLRVKEIVVVSKVEEQRVENAQVNSTDLETRLQSLAKERVQLAKELREKGLKRIREGGWPSIFPPEEHSTYARYQEVSEEFSTLMKQLGFERHYFSKDVGTLSADAVPYHGELLEPRYIPIYSKSVIEFQNNGTSKSYTLYLVETALEKNKKEKVEIAGKKQRALGQALNGYTLIKTDEDISKILKKCLNDDYSAPRSADHNVLEVLSSSIRGGFQTLLPALFMANSLATTVLFLGLSTFDYAWGRKEERSKTKPQELYLGGIRFGGGSVDYDAIRVMMQKVRKYQSPAVKPDNHGIESGQKQRDNFPVTGHCCEGKIFTGGSIMDYHHAEDCPTMEERRKKYSKGEESGNARYSAGENYHLISYGGSDETYSQQNDLKKINNIINNNNLESLLLKKNKEELGCDVDGTIISPGLYLSGKMADAYINFKNRKKNK